MQLSSARAASSALAVRRRGRRSTQIPSSTPTPLNAHGISSSADYVGRVPITFAHPVAVLPFARWLPLPALVAGAVAPDVVYYLPVPLSGSVTHSMVGVPVWDLLIGVGVLAAFRLSAGPAAALFPFRLALPTPRYSGGPGRRAASIVVAVVVGATTHFVWDSCTQTAGFAVQHLAVLRAPVVEPHKVYNVIGYASSLLGTATLVHLLIRRAHSSTPSLPAPWRHLIGTGLVLAPAISAVRAVDDPATLSSTYDLIRHTIVAAARSAACAWLAYVVCWHCARLRRQPRHRVGAGPGSPTGAGSGRFQARISVDE